MYFRLVPSMTVPALCLMLLTGCGGESRSPAVSAPVAVISTAPVDGTAMGTSPGDPGPDVTPITDEPSTAQNNDEQARTDSVAEPIAAAPSTPATTPAASIAAVDHSYPAPPSMKMDPVSFDPSAKQAFVRVYLTRAAPTTVIARVYTKNGSGENYMYSGGHYVATKRTVIFRPGDPLEQTVAIPIKKAKEGGHFTVYIPSVPSGATRGTSSVTITAVKGASNTEISFAGRAPRRFEPAGPPSYDLHISTMRWSDAGGPGMWKTAHSHGRAQPANGETGLYLDDRIYSTAEAPFRVEGGNLVIHSQKLATPIAFAGLNNGVGKGTYAYGAAVLTGFKNPETYIRYGQLEWVAKMPDRRGSWPALWLIGIKGWPPEIDVYEGFNHDPSFKAANMASGAIHGGPNGMRKYARGYSENVAEAYGIAPTLTTDFHRFAVDIQPDYITWFVDGVEVFQATNSLSGEFYPIMNVAVKTSNAYDQGSGDMVVQSFRIWRTAN